jgi:histidinol-phosphatase
MNSPVSVRSLLDFAVDATIQAGKITLKYFQSHLEIETKQDESPVTIADRETETMLRDLISRYFPDHSIVGEEFGSSSGNSEYTWYIDPIDGTQSFIRGVPIYGVLLGLERQNELLLGVVNLPALNEMVFAARGEGCFWNSKTCHVSDTKYLRDSLACIAGQEYFQQTNRVDAHRAIEGTTGRIRTWGDCYGHVLVATGRADLCVDPILSAWDAAPMIPILEEAGGVFTDWKGTATIHNREGISTNADLLPEILNVLASAQNASSPG